nr:uncharacterized protein LOC117683886 isoform X1 [Crassostrea gigas]
MSIILLGTFFSFLPLQESKSKNLDGYKFPVYSTDFCPRNEAEWKERSNILKCTEQNGYTCLPNEQFTELLEFCYTDPWILIEEGLCLYLIKKNSKVHGYNCHNFQFGCPTSSYLSTEIYKHPACLLVENGCFYAEPTCKKFFSSVSKDTDEREGRKINTSNRKKSKIYPNTTDDSTATYLHETTVYVQREIDTIEDRKWVLDITLLALGFLIGVSCIVLIFRKKKEHLKHSCVPSVFIPIPAAKI